MPALRALTIGVVIVAILGCDHDSDRPETAGTQTQTPGAARVPVAVPGAASPAAAVPAASGMAMPKKDVAVSGSGVFAVTCVSCHQANGEGVPDKYPPLAGSEWVNGSEERMLRIVIGGLTGDVEVQGETFSGAMPGWGPTLSNAQIAAVVTYVRSQWGNTAGGVDTATVARVRAASASRTAPWSVADLRK